jgi:hypothetical protein
MLSGYTLGMLSGCDPDGIAKEIEMSTTSAAEVGKTLRRAGFRAFAHRSTSRTGFVVRSTEIGVTVTDVSPALVDEYAATLASSGFVVERTADSGLLVTRPS